jgi:large subunit ribosomal protein L4
MAAALEARVLGGAKTATAPLAADTFGVERNDGLVHEVVKAELAARRQGTHATKTRGLVSGGRSKPWRQKGTGRARAGTTRAAQWTGGGVVFGPQPRSYATKVNRKARAKALRIALSVHAADGTLATVDGAGLTEPRTKAAAELLAGWRGHGPLVVVVAAGEDAVVRSFRNLERTHVVEVGELEVADVVWAHWLVVTQGALAALEGREGE